jgi:PEGA domain
LTQKNRNLTRLALKSSANKIRCNFILNSTPPGASIYLDGSNKGTTPKTISGVSTGSHTIKIIKSGYEDYNKQVTVTAEKTASVSVDLVEIISVRDNPPTVSISVSPRTVHAGDYFTVTVTGTDDIGLASIWWGDNTGDTALNKAHVHYCTGKSCTYNWKVSTYSVGTIKLCANSRDSAYPTAGETHQASEGEGIKCRTVTVLSGL